MPSKQKIIKNKFNQERERFKNCKILIFLMDYLFFYCIKGIIPKDILTLIAILIHGQDLISICE